MRKIRLQTGTARPGSGVGLALAFALALVLTPSPDSRALGGPVQFASFTTATGTPFSFTSNGSSPALGDDAGTGNVSSAAAVVSSLSAINNVENLSVDGTPSVPVYTAVSILDLPNHGPATETIVFNDLATSQALLTVTFTGGMTGQLGNATASLGSPAGLSLLSYSSASLPSYLSLPANFQLSLPDDGTTTVAASVSHENSFSPPDASGQFFTNPTSIVPAPASAVMFAIGLSAVAILAAWKTRRRKLILIPVTE
jgi:hypothetical protein